MTYAIVRKEYRQQETTPSMWPVTFNKGLLNKVFFEVVFEINEETKSNVTLYFLGLAIYANKEDFDFYPTIEQAKEALNE